MTEDVGLFDNDLAYRFLYQLMEKLIKNIVYSASQVCCDDDVEILANVELLVLLWEHYKFPPSISPPLVNAWREKSLQRLADNEPYPPSSPYYFERKQVIEETFARLEALNNQK